ncbi:B3 domain-containing protein, partial [Trifolium pratense]
DNQIMTNTTKEFPDFFIVFLTEKHTERMLIPIAFAKLVRLKRRVMPYFILRDRRGRDWHVKVRPIGRKLYFDDGWKRFGEDNSLEENDVLVFTHIENNVFKFKIFELSSMCEKIKEMDVEEENNMMEDQEEVELDDDDNNEDDDDVDDGDDNMMAKEEEDDDEEAYKGFGRSEHQHCRTYKDRSIGSSSAVPKLEDDEIDAKIIFQKVLLRISAFAFQSISTLYVATARYLLRKTAETYPSSLDVQANEIAAYHHVLPQMSATHIEKRGEICNWSDGRVYVKGWADFCTMSNITENDRCLCEIVLREDGTIEMLMVHIVNVE